MTIVVDETVYCVPITAVPAKLRWIVTGRLDARERVAVTTAVPPFSVNGLPTTDRLTAGVGVLGTLRMTVKAAGALIRPKPDWLSNPGVPMSIAVDSRVWK